MKFIHAADLHIDSPLRGLSRYEGAPVERLRGATRHALARLVQQRGGSLIPPFDHLPVMAGQAKTRPAT